MNPLIGQDHKQWLATQRIYHLHLSEKRPNIDINVGKKGKHLNLMVANRQRSLILGHNRLLEYQNQVAIENSTNRRKNTIKCFNPACMSVNPQPGCNWIKCRVKGCRHKSCGAQSCQELLALHENKHKY